MPRSEQDSALKAFPSRLKTQQSPMRLSRLNSRPWTRPASAKNGSQPEKAGCVEKLS